MTSVERRTSMKRVGFAAVAKSCVFLFVWLVLSPAAWAQGVSQTLIGLAQGTNTLIRFNSATPGTLSGTLPVTGLVAGDTLKSIDVRPATGALYAIATDATNTQVRTYTIDMATGVATAVGGPVTLPTAGALWGMSFNPTVDRIRLVNDQDENARINPDGGALAGDDTNLSPGTVTVDSVAYDNQFAGATTTTLFALNQATNSLATIGGVGGTPSPNGGLVTDIGALGVTFAGSPTGFDIATNGAAFAALRLAGGAQALYTLNLTTGAATLVGAIGDGTLTLDALAVVDPSLALSPGTGTFTSRQRFDLVLLIDPQGRALTSGTATFNGVDVTPFVASCIVPGTTSTGMITFRCPNLGGPVTGPGVHTLQVRLVLSDGSPIQSTVRWTVIPVVEP